MDSFLELMKSTSGEFGLLEFFVSVFFSLIAGIICMLLYRVYFHMSFDRNESLTKSFVIIAPSISAVFWAIQYSLPLSLGLLGALSFVRFRTPIKKPEDIGFILLVIALSLLSSVFRFYAAGVLLALIACVVFVKSLVIDRSLPMLGMGKTFTAFISIDSAKVDEIDSGIREALMGKLVGLKESDLTLNDVAHTEGGYSLRYSIYLKKSTDKTIPIAIGALNTLDNLVRVEVFDGRVA
ncbi:MAG: DUF4956 domain-containing protein [Thermodesulfobacteriota bacterium]